MVLLKQHRQTIGIIIAILIYFIPDHFIPDSFHQLMGDIGLKNMMCTIFLVFTIKVLWKFSPSKNKIYTYTRLTLWVSFGITMIMMLIGGQYMDQLWTGASIDWVWIVIAIAVINLIDLLLKDREGNAQD